VRELPERILRVVANAGSFDCVVIRFANNYFAQDDRMHERLL